MVKGSQSCLTLTLLCINIVWKSILCAFARVESDKEVIYNTLEWGGTWRMMASLLRSLFAAALSVPSLLSAAESQPPSTVGLRVWQRRGRDSWREGGDILVCPVIKPRYLQRNTSSLGEKESEWGGLTPFLKDRLAYYQVIQMKNSTSEAPHTWLLPGGTPVLSSVFTSLWKYMGLFPGIKQMLE